MSEADKLQVNLSYYVEANSLTTQCDMTAVMQYYYKGANCEEGTVREVVNVWGRCYGPLQDTEDSEKYYYILTSAKSLTMAIYTMTLLALFTVFA